MAEKKTTRKNKKHGTDTYWLGPYEGSNGRKQYVKKTRVGKGKWTTTSTPKARKDVEDRSGALRSGQEVDHKDNDKRNDSPSNLRVISKSDNVAKENRRRAGKKAAPAKKAPAKKTAHKK